MTNKKNFGKGIINKEGKIIFTQKRGRDMPESHGQKGLNTIYKELDEKYSNYELNITIRK